MAKRSTDLLVVSDGFRPSVYLLWAMTVAGDDWLAENVQADAQRFGRGVVVVEHRLIGDPVRGALDDGLRVR
jgi:hypothetical protein